MSHLSLAQAWPGTPSPLPTCWGGWGGLDCPVKPSNAAGEPRNARDVSRRTIIAALRAFSTLVLRPLAQRHGRTGSICYAPRLVGRSAARADDPNKQIQERDERL